MIGLHCTAPDETCRWVGIDIDAHDGQGACPEANFRFAREVRARAIGAGLQVRLIDSSGGRGGYHLWIVFDRPARMADARRLALWLVRDWTAHGLTRIPDLFPGNHRLTGKRCGTWLRLPGRHHKRPAWARIWSPRRGWLAGDAAIDGLLSLVGQPVDVASIVPADFVSEKPKSASKVKRRKASVAPEGGPSPLRPASSVPKRHRTAGQVARDLQLAGLALEVYLNIDLEYDEWIEVAMALKNLEDAAAFALFDRWSSISAKYDPEVTAAKWQGLRPADDSGGITLGTLFRRAMDWGWPGPAFVESVDPLGLKRSTHRSGRRGRVVIPITRAGANQLEP